ncbi:hypothetical protein [Microlunatus speluncae]|uniref:hypothetical protein n=1 Tax=Microlunatus speluncae TaxID=2594267 RepID=UPI001FE7F562|nr:hypothetical protein [Microlunatus speluncae]
MIAKEEVALAVDDQRSLRRLGRRRWLCTDGRGSGDRGGGGDEIPAIDIPHESADYSGPHRRTTF